MEEKKYKCPSCGKFVTESNGIRIDKRVYHKSCYKRKIKAEQEKVERKKLKEEARIRKEIEKTKQPLVIPEAVSEDEAKLKDHFFKTIKDITGNDKLSAKTYALAERYIKEYSFTWIGMEKTIIYVCKLCEYAPSEDIVGIIPWKYSEAEEFYESINNIESSKDKLKDLYKTKTIKIRPKKNNAPSIDISQLGV